MTHDLFDKLDEMSREAERKERLLDEDLKEIERADHSLDLYLTSVPLLILAGGVASASHTNVGWPLAEILSWIFLILAFLTGIFGQRLSSLFGYYDYQCKLRRNDDHYEKQRLREIQKYAEIEDVPKIKKILEEYYADESARAERYLARGETSIEKLVKEHKEIYETFLKYIPLTFFVFIVIGLASLITSRASALF